MLLSCLGVREVLAEGSGEFDSQQSRDQIQRCRLHGYLHEAEMPLDG